MVSGPEAAKKFENRYSRLERLLHRIAFRGWGVQTALAEIEDSLFGKQFKAINITRPVFVTGLPRAGTTLILELIETQPQFVAHTYRDMPFLLVPLLWSRLSQPFQEPNASMERAHGDGVMVNADSTEAFEEVIWRQFWKDHYQADRILLWGDQRDPEFETFFTNHIRKIIALRKPAESSGARYVSKNNLNISRLDLIRRVFPDAVIIVPFRSPQAQAASLLRQHLNFLDMHAADPFARRYMEAIGHYDFGANLRPIAFGDFFAEGRRHDPLTLAFWVEYWAAAYGHILAAKTAGVTLISYEALSAAPERTLKGLAGLLELENPEALTRLAGRIRASAATGAHDKLPDGLVARVDEIHEQLCARALNVD